ncbi:MAG: ankyrin repeat domain-containing protein [Acidobacteria bacterium]|nr:ankyrin repeat domain-containing protein [Acidobacteriota bacterium]
MRTNIRLSDRLQIELLLVISLGCWSPLCAGEGVSSWDQALDWLEPCQLFEDPLIPGNESARKIESGQWYVRLRILDAWNEFPVDIGILGSYRGAPARLVYRTVAILGTRKQLALLHLRRPTESQESLESTVVLEHLELLQGETPAFDPTLLVKELRALRGEILPIEPGGIHLDPTSYLLELHDGPDGPSTRYQALAGLFNREELIIKNKSDFGLNPFCRWLQQLYLRLHGEWKKRMADAKYRPLLDAIDVRRDGAVWFGGACAEHWAGFAQAILDAGLDIRRPGLDCVPPLVSAAGSGDVGLVQQFLSRGVSPNVTDAAEGKTPLMSAAGSGSLAVVKTLLASRARLDAQTQPPFCITALDHAVESGSVELVRFLLDRGARQCRGDVETPPLLFWAINHDDPDLMGLLVEHRWDINEASACSTPLTYALENRRLKAARYLLDHGARADEGDVERAVRIGDEELVEIAREAAHRE